MPEAHKPVEPGLGAALRWSGCLVIVGWALLGCLLLFLNGGIVMALINVSRERGVDWLRDERVSQFLVLVGPVALLVMQWWMIDWMRGKLGRRR